MDQLGNVDRSLWIGTTNGTFDNSWPSFFTSVGSDTIIINKNRLLIVSLRSIDSR
jgi:hypothetical protein